MAPRGPLAKANKHGRTPSMVDWIDVPDAPYTGQSPDLPVLPRRKKWHPMVEQWWAQVRAMPHCALWRPVDWTYAVETALLKQGFWNAYDAGEEKTTAAVEIRRREDQMGTTQEARRRLRIRYVDPDLISTEDLDAPFDPAAGAPDNVTSIANRRARLTG
jgi:hypothetical protein